MKVALIGHGMVAETHVRALSDSSIVTMRGLHGRDPARARSFLEDAQLEQPDREARVYENVQAICNDPDLDFVILTTPPNARLEFVEALAVAKLPVLMEKPVERSLAAAQRIADIFASQRVLAGVLFQHRAREASRTLKELISDGALGNVETAEIRVPWWRDQSYYDEPGRGTYARDGGGVMISQAIHTLDLAIWLLGPIRAVQSVIRSTSLHQMEGEDWAGGLLEFENGAVGTLTATTAFYPGRPESISVQGTKAHAHLESGVLTISYLNGRVAVTGEAAAGTGGGADPMAFTHAWHKATIEDFAMCIQSGQEPLCSVRDALQVHMVIDAMERASKSHQTIKINDCAGSNGVV
ncbi:MAG: Gfo/Idh/MocA family oxidoreductase [Boseongicola sp.]|nr:Gfo/Idh/MocA family oxidoreductase [Boseongicola sp.]